MTRDRPPYVRRLFDLLGDVSGVVRAARVERRYRYASHAQGVAEHTEYAAVLHSGATLRASHTYAERLRQALKLA